MLTLATRFDHGLRTVLSADKVERAAGVIRGATVAKAGVEATGKIVMLDARGQVTRDETLCAKTLPVFTDGETLKTLMAAAAAGGGRFKSREDHDDAIGARAGYTTGFRLDGDRVAADVHLFASYRNREIVLEAADLTPEEIGLSIDFTPRYEIANGRALMRVVTLHGVDIVDEGAITHGGMFYSAGVDSARKGFSAELKTPNPMTIEELAAQVTKLSAAIESCSAQLTKMSSVTPPAPAKDEELSALRKSNEKLAADVAATNEKLKALADDRARERRERSLMGFRGSETERAQLAASDKTAEDIAQLNAQKKTYMQLVADLRASNTKLSAADAHDAVRRTTEGQTAYALHLSSKGITPRTTMAA